MDAKVTLLEERVLRAVSRLKELSVERARLEEEIRRLRADRAVEPGDATAGAVPEPVARAIRGAIRELRRD